MRAWIHGVRSSAFSFCCRLWSLLLLRPSVPPHAQREAVISGTVVARATGQPIVGATVTVEGSAASRRTASVVSSCVSRVR